MNILDMYNIKFLNTNSEYSFSSLYIWIFLAYHNFFGIKKYFNKI